MADESAFENIPPDHFITFGLVISVRLVGGGSPSEGTVQVYYQGIWGTICDNKWDLYDANVVCRQLGFLSASHVWQDAHFGPGSGPILLDYVDCSGSEYNISDCGHNGRYNFNCDHDDDAGVTCFDTESPVIEGTARHSHVQPMFKYKDRASN